VIDRDLSISFSHSLSDPRGVLVLVALAHSLLR